MPVCLCTWFVYVIHIGEADSAEPKMHMYNCTFPAMIDDWRAKFSAQSGQTDPGFPFGFVQVSSMDHK